jgi:hypothetical protein
MYLMPCTSVDLRLAPKSRLFIPFGRNRKHERNLAEFLNNLSEFGFKLFIQIDRNEFQLCGRMFCYNTCGSIENWGRKLFQINELLKQFNRLKITERKNQTLRGYINRCDWVIGFLIRKEQNFSNSFITPLTSKSH